MLTLCHGVAVGWPSTALPALQNEDVVYLSDADISWLASLPCLTALFISPFWNFAASHLSRKVLILLACLCIILNWSVLLAQSASVVAHYVARFLVGVAASGVVVVVPLYVTEISQDSVRGTLGCFFTFFLNLGFLLSYVLGAVASYYTTLLVHVSPSLLFLLFLLWIPESPRYLVEKSRFEDAAKSLRWLRGNDFYIEGELEALKGPSPALPLTDVVTETSSPPPEPSSRRNWTRGTWKALLICVILLAAQHLSGVYVLLTYTVHIFETAGSALSAHASTVVVGSLQVFGGFVSSVLADRAGRRMLLLASTGSMAALMATVGLFPDVHWLTVTSLSLFVVAFSVGLCSVPFVFLGELFSPRTRAVANSVAVSTMWFSCFGALKVFPTLEQELKMEVCYWVFGAVCAVCFAFVVFFVPETKGKSLQQIIAKLDGTTNEQGN